MNDPLDANWKTSRGKELRYSFGDKSETATSAVGPRIPDFLSISLVIGMGTWTDMDSVITAALLWQNSSKIILFIFVFINCIIFHLFCGGCFTSYVSYLSLRLPYFSMLSPLSFLGFLRDFLLCSAVLPPWQQFKTMHSEHRDPKGGTTLLALKTWEIGKLSKDQKSHFCALEDL